MAPKKTQATAAYVVTTRSDDGVYHDSLAAIAPDPTDPNVVGIHRIRFLPELDGPGKYSYAVVVTTAPRVPRGVARDADVGEPTLQKCPLRWAGAGDVPCFSDKYHHVVGLTAASVGQAFTRAHRALRVDTLRCIDLKTGEVFSRRRTSSQPAGDADMDWTL